MIDELWQLIFFVTARKRKKTKKIRMAQWQQTEQSSAGLAVCACCTVRDLPHIRVPSARGSSSMAVADAKLRSLISQHVRSASRDTDILVRLHFTHSRESNSGTCAHSSRSTQPTHTQSPPPPTASHCSPLHACACACWPINASDDEHTERRSCSRIHSTTLRRR